IASPAAINALLLRDFLSRFLCGFFPLDLNSPSVLGNLWCFHRYFEHAILEVCFCRFAFEALRQRYLTPELSITSFRTIDTFLALLVLVLAFAFNKDGVLCDIHLHVVLCQAWKIGGNHELSIALEHIHVRRKCFRGRPWTEAFQCRETVAFKHSVKHSIHLIRKPPHHAERTRRRPRLHSGNLPLAARLNGLCSFSILRTFTCHRNLTS